MHALRTHRNMRIHVAIAAAVLIAAIVLGVSRLELIALLLSITFVLVAEMLNTAIESAIDVATTSFDPMAKLAKDIAAGAVLISAVNAIVVGYLVFSGAIAHRSERLLHRLANAPAELTLIALVVVILAVIVTKAITGRGTPLRGGLPSGHAALAFAGWMAVTLVLKDSSHQFLVSSLALIMALLVAQTRVESGVHSTLEVAYGAALGALVTLVLFQVGRVKSGFVGVAGRPNVGKSTLVNALCGGKVAIVSDKPQTTRRRIRGIVNGDDLQLVLVDLPGFQRPLDPLTEHMQRTVDESLQDVDAALIVLDGRRRIGGGDRFVAERLFGLGVPVVIVLNKVDRMKPGRDRGADRRRLEARRLPRASSCERADGIGVAELRDELVELLPEGPAYFPTDQRSDLPLEVQVAEIVREKALALTREEVPHAISVEVEELGEKVVRAIVYVETESQKRIVVGKGGRMVREIGVRARPELELLLARRIYLELQVKVKERWRSDERMLDQLGL